MRGMTWFFFYTAEAKCYFLASIVSIASQISGFYCFALENWDSKTLGLLYG